MSYNISLPFVQPDIALFVQPDIALFVKAKNVAVSSKYMLRWLLAVAFGLFGLPVDSSKFVSEETAPRPS
jgi:hypothetical protein